MTTTQTRTNIREKLAEFAANTTYQLWCLKKSPSSIRPLTNASPQFIRFCKQLISITQLSETAVILALKYVQKLIMGEGPISTEDGWEYRLFTGSLILANKILDDHSYTNKTWSQVTTIPLLELNQVEQEFLKNCGYELYVSNMEYLDWLRSLQAFNLFNKEQNQQQQSNQQQQQQQQSNQQQSNQQSQKVQAPPGINLPGITYLLERSQSQDRNYDLFGNDNQAKVQMNRSQPGPGIIQRPVKAIIQNQSTRIDESPSVHSSTSGHKVTAINLIFNNRNDNGVSNIDNSITRHSSDQNSQNRYIGNDYDLFGNSHRLMSIKDFLNKHADDKISNNCFDQSFAEPVFQDKLSSNNGSGHSLTSIDYILNHQDDNSATQHFAEPVSQDQLDSNYDLFGNDHGFSTIFNHLNNQSDNSVTQLSTESNSQNQSLSSSYDSYSDGDRFKYYDNNGTQNHTESISQDQIMNDEYDSYGDGGHRFTSINHLFNNLTDERYSFIRPPPGFENTDNITDAQSSPVAQIRPPPGFEKIDIIQPSTISQIRPPPGFENVDPIAVDQSSTTTVSRSNVARPTAADRMTTTFGRTPRMMYQHLVASKISSNPPTPTDEPRGITKYVPVTIAGAFAAFRN